MSDLKDVVEALANQIKTNMPTAAISGTTYAFAPNLISTPAAVVLPAQENPVTYDETMDGRDHYNLKIKVLMGSADDQSGQQELMQYLGRTGTKSIYAAVAADPTLGGTLSYAIVTQATGYGDTEWNGQVFFGAELDVEAVT